MRSTFINTMGEAISGFIFGQYHFKFSHDFLGLWVYSWVEGSMTREYYDASSLGYSIWYILIWFAYWYILFWMSCGIGQVRSVLLSGHIPKTVICIPSWSIVSVKIFSSQLIPFFWSKMSRYTSSAPHRSAYLATCSIPLLMVASREPHTILHSMTKRWEVPSGRNQRIKRSVLPFPSPYSRVIWPPPFIIRWRNAWRSNCGPASRYVNLSS